MNEWYYGRNGQQQGPVTSNQLKQLAQSGQLLPTDPVWKEGMSEWASASKVKGLFPERLSSESSTGVNDLAKQAEGGLRKAASWFSDTIGPGKALKVSRRTIVAGNWQSDDGSQISFVPENQTFGTNRFTLIHGDGSSIECELDEKTFRIRIGQEEAIVNPSTNRLIWKGRQYKKAPSEAGKQLVDATKGALGWVSKNVGSAGKRDQHRIKELAGSWLPLDETQPPLLISADDANRRFAGGTHAIGVHRDDGFSAKGEFVHADMMLNLTPETEQPLSVKVINLTEHELVLSWPHGPVHYQRTHPGVLADYRRARQAAEQGEACDATEMPSAQATDVTFHDVQIAFVCGSCGSNSTTPPSILEQPMPQAPCASCGKPNYLPSALNHEGRIYTYCHCCWRIVHAPEDHSGLELDCPYQDCEGMVQLPGEQRLISPEMKRKGKIALAVTGVGMAVAVGSLNYMLFNQTRSVCPNCKAEFSMFSSNYHSGRCPKCGFAMG